jgi:hypothetical protein
LFPALWAAASPSAVWAGPSKKGPLLIDYVYGFGTSPTFGMREEGVGVVRQKSDGVIAEWENDAQWQLVLSAGCLTHADLNP